jgi:hypothetical protein
MIFNNIYKVISTCVEIGKTKNCVETRCQGGVFSPNNWRLLHLLFGVLRIFGTLIELNRKRSHDCSDCPYSKAGAARTVM